MKEMPSCPRCHSDIDVKLSHNVWDDEHENEMYHKHGILYDCWNCNLEFRSKEKIRYIDWSKHEN